MASANHKQPLCTFCHKFFLRTNGFFFQLCPYFCSALAPHPQAKAAGRAALLLRQAGADWGPNFPSPFCKPTFFSPGRIFSCLLSYKGSAVPGSLASQCFLLKQPSNLPWNPKASFPMTRDSKKYCPFPVLIMAERVSFLVSNSPKHVQVFLLELANFQAELPIKISFNFNTFSPALGLWKQLQAASFPGSPSQGGCKFVFPGTTIPRRQFLFPQTRNQGLLGLLQLLKGFLLP